ncbi:SDR family NAD(P)-dependent oxidoreductase [Roseomonas sp. CCTCC AB2023176]|uniref:SDR family NAD(P)-dependent oxidoreductase n=1 Tax=Roseomonas sp. CCTCC AB2023176 TaxID=3342640 RepID=UPI0035DDFA74
MDRDLLVLGLGYAGEAIAREAASRGWRVAGTRRDPAASAPPPGVAVLPFDRAGEGIATATHVVVTAAPGEAGDPVLAAHCAALRDGRARWIGYLSTTAVYGDRDGGWVDETTEAAPTLARARRRRDAERAWEAFSPPCAVDLFRVGGIYGPGRSPFDDLRDGTARRTIKPGHAFSRIHRDDIALAVLAAAEQSGPPAIRVLHLVDDEPAESAAVVEEAARLLDVAPPAPVPFDVARETMSPMALSFWAESRRVANDRTKAALGIAWRYPTYREGLRGILTEEADGRRAGAASPGTPRAIPGSG